MIINKKVEDKAIDAKIRKYGARKLAEKLKVSAAYICMALNYEKYKQPMSWNKYLKIKKIV